MSNAPKPGGTPIKRTNYNYSWPVPTRNPKGTRKNVGSNATNGKLGDKTPVKGRVTRVTV